jgi:small subunit ribosomal protein S2
MVDTNSDPREVEYVIPANDDASKSIDKILTIVTAAIIDGLANKGAEVEFDAEATAETAEVEVETPAIEEVVVETPTAEAETPVTEE